MSTTSGLFIFRYPFSILKRFFYHFAESFDKTALFLNSGLEFLHLFMQRILDILWRRQKRTQLSTNIPNLAYIAEFGAKWFVKRIV